MPRPITHNDSLRHNICIPNLFLASLGAVLALVLTACSSEDLTPDIPDLASDPGVIDMAPELEEARFLLLRTSRWPGGGRELTIGVVAATTGKAFPTDLSRRITVRTNDGSALKTKVQPLALPPGYTALLLPPSLSASERASLSQAILDFVARRPTGERIALYRHGASVQLFSNFLADPVELKEALDRYQRGTDDPAPLSLLQAVGPVVSEVRAVGGIGPDVMRSMIVLTKDPKSVLVNYSQVYVTAATPDAAGLQAASDALEDARTHAFYKLSACGAETKVSVAVQVDMLKGALGTSFPATLPEELGASCNVDAIDSRTRVYTPVIELVFDDAQRAAHALRVKATQTATYDEVLAKSEFQTQLRLAPGQPTILATAHLHGQSSLRCARHSYAIALEGSARYLLPDSASDEYTLVSMCDDPAYVYAPTVFGLLADDLYFLKQRFVEVIIDGKTQGIYILMEKAQDELRRDTARTTAVMRRQYPVAGKDAFEVLYSSTDDVAPATRYQTFFTAITPLTGTDLITALQNQMDLDQYLRYLGNQSIFKSGDYIDEAFFFASEQADGIGGVGEIYRVMAWDPEGYTTCHSGGVNAYVDANNLAYCAEGRLDFKILADPKVYALFVQKIEAALSGTLTRERMAAMLTQTVTRLHAQLTNPAVCAAMTELLAFNPGAADCAVARSVIQARADYVLSQYDLRRAYLLMQLAAYHVKFG